MKNICFVYHKTKIGELIIASYQEKICILDFRFRKLRNRIDNRLKKSLNANFIEKETEIIKKAKIQLNEYFRQERKSFEIEILPIGTEFQKLVWNKLLKINYGETISYKKLAEEIFKEKGYQAVANANASNSIAIIIPCHRVIGENKKLTGYNGGLSVKKFLLDLESNRN